MREISELENNNETIRELDEKIISINEFSSLAIEESDDKSINDCFIEIKEIISEIESHEFKLKFNAKLCC